MFAVSASSFSTEDPLSGLTLGEPASRAPRKIPGKASTLLIWFG